ncbi:peptidase inhibitor family I36 protein [Actinoplanes sp. NPDC026623]|uniref:peptidase inhibitor family I36 protein n=1 Tax=Actinoplanes sp. NPDC026623 TaxID=3155610 RepID=UPI0033DA957C
MRLIPTATAVRTRRRQGTIALAATMMLAIAGLAGSTATAAAASTKAKAPATTYTAAQKKALQAEVTKHLNDYGRGTQVGINEISWDGGRTILTLPLPGETKARAVGEPVAALAAANCAFAYACLWSDTNFTGSRLSRTDCEEIVLAAPYKTSTASIHNNQTSGTQTMVLNSAHDILNSTLAPSRVNDTGVASRGLARYWKVC